MSTQAVPLMRMTRISKEFPGVRALSGIDFTLQPGEVHVLFGENGAGKSTLISILSGVFQQTSGTIEMDGQEIGFRSVAEAARHGVGTVFQEFSLVPTATVFESIYLGSEPRCGPFIDRRAMIAGARALFQRLGFDIDVRRTVSALSRAQQQMVEIAKAFRVRARVLILDEPTASLTEKETRKLFDFIAQAARGGVGVIYISHRIHEFQEIADRITILRDGRLVATVAARETSEARLIELMTGRSIDQVYPRIARQADGRTVLSLRNVHATGVKGVNLDVRAGEVLGVAGLVGSGKSRVWRSVLGLQPVTAGTVALDGRDVTGAPTRELLRGGIFYLPPDRKAEGLQLSATSRENIALSVIGSKRATGWGFVPARRTRALVDAIGKRVGLSSASLDRTVSHLSGGNQQKVLFAKGFSAERRIYVFDEPTVGVDMGTRAALYLLIKQIAESGKAVVVISSDLPEVMNLAHRLLVFADGRIAEELAGDDITEANVLKHFFAEAGAGT